MQISSRFTIALHILTALETFKAEGRLTSGFLAGSVGVNPVIIRNVLLQLKAAGLVSVGRGANGTITFARPLEDISYYDIYNAIHPVKKGSLFSFHERPNIECPVGKNIHALLDGHLLKAQKAMEDELKSMKLKDSLTELAHLLQK